jgi:hypothetical protein
MIQFCHDYESSCNMTHLKNKLERVVANALDQNGNRPSKEKEDQDYWSNYLERIRKIRHELDMRLEKVDKRMKELQKEEDEIDEMIKKIKRKQ